jgi:hypothetical protein
LYVPPDRSPRDLLQRPAARYYEALRLGLRVSLDSGATEPLLTPYESICIGAGDCPDVRVDSAVTPRGVIHVAALPTSSAIGVYDASATSPRLIDVRSPRFVRDGRSLQPNDNVEARMRWKGQNSTIAQVLAFADAVAVVHARPQIEPNYRVGDPLQFIAYLNVYGWDGQVRVRDVPLSSVSVGRGDNQVYIVDYEGRTGDSQRLRVIEMPMPSVTR